jgi:precorrin-2 dehydrogenase/sirohydrochlorin ferrochelatase
VSPPAADGTTPGRDSPDYPVLLSVAGRPALVVGGGPVGTRRAQGLLDCGARVTMVAPSTGAAAASLLESAPADRFRLETRAYRAGEAAAYDVVVTTTGVEAVDREVVDDALGGGALVVGPDGGSVRSVHLPAVHREGAVTLAVSTSGRSPALSTWLRDRLAASAGPHLATVAEMVGERRRTLQQDGASVADADWGTAIDRVVPLVEAGHIEEAREVLGRVGGDRQ